MLVIKIFKSNYIKMFVVVILSMSTSFDVNALEKIRWKVQVISNVGYWKPLWSDFVKNLKILSESKIKFRIYEPNKIVPNNQVWEAIADEQLDAALTSPIYKSSKIPALHFFSGVPFGPGFIEHTAWIRYGGGQELKNKIYGEMGLYAFDCVMTPPESGGCFKNKVEDISQLKGEKLDFSDWEVRLWKK